jgi:hypothetical protein
MTSYCDQWGDEVATLELLAAQLQHIRQKVLTLVHELRREEESLRQAHVQSAGAARARLDDGLSIPPRPRPRVVLGDEGVVESVNAPAPGDSAPQLAVVGANVVWPACWPAPGSRPSDTEAT